MSSQGPAYVSKKLDSLMISSPIHPAEMGAGQLWKPGGQSNPRRKTPSASAVPALVAAMFGAHSGKASFRNAIGDVVIAARKMSLNFSHRLPRFSSWSRFVWKTFY
jgi:hypothetical protein